MKQKGIYYCLASLCILTVMFTCCYYISYKIALAQFNSRSIEQTKEYGQINLSSKKESNHQEISLDTVPVDITQSIKVIPTTKYVLEVVDLVRGTKDIIQGNPPNQFIGLTKDEITLELEKYLSDMTLSDYKKGLIAYELISFSDKSITIQKIYDSNQVQYKYYACIYNGYVTIYYSDLKSVYEYTMIEGQKLPEKERVDLSRGIYLKDEAALYSLLESLSS